MGHKYQINLIGDSTDETLDRMLPALNSEFLNFDSEKKEKNENNLSIYKWS
jgi:hypothetical protein